MEREIDRERQRERESGWSSEVREENVKMRRKPI